MALSFWFLILFILDFKKMQLKSHSKTVTPVLVFDGEGTEPREGVENNIHIYTFKKWFTNTMHGFVHQTSLQVIKSRPIFCLPNVSSNTTHILGSAWDKESKNTQIFTLLDSKAHLEVNNMLLHNANSSFHYLNDQ